MFRNNSYHYSPRKNLTSSKWRSALVLVILIGLGAFLWSNFDKVSGFNGTGGKILGIFTHNDRSIDDKALQAKLDPLLPKDWTIGIYLYDIKSRSSFGYNADQAFEAASLTKVPVLITVYQALQSGKLQQTDQIPFDQSELEDYGTSILQYNGPGTTYSVKDLAWYMANRSDNSAFQIFLDKFGDTSIDQSIQGWGFAKTSIVKDVTTPRDMVLMFNDIYGGDLVTDSVLNQQMQDLLIKTNEESRIPAGVPGDVRVVHKTGNAVGGIQDVGIVYLQDRPYVLALLTDGVSDENGAESTEAQISKVIYQYLSTLN